jgi:PIN domain nuclease of toxin-antitoxin system
MKILLDTHILLWAVFEPEKLSQELKAIIADYHNYVYVSLASLWEIAIKKNIGRLDIPDDFFETIFNNSGFEPLPVQMAHIQLFLKLPLHHRDPFDRILIAQAISRKLMLVTNDQQIMSYDVPILKL